MIIKTFLINLQIGTFLSDKIELNIFNKYIGEDIDLVRAIARL